MKIDRYDKMAAYLISVGVSRDHASLKADLENLDRGDGIPIESLRDRLGISGDRAARICRSARRIDGQDAGTLQNLLFTVEDADAWISREPGAWRRYTQSLNAAGTRSSRTRQLREPATSRSRGRRSEQPTEPDRYDRMAGYLISSVLPDRDHASLKRRLQSMDRGDGIHNDDLISQLGLSPDRVSRICRSAAKIDGQDAGTLQNMIFSVEDANAWISREPAAWATYARRMWPKYARRLDRESRHR